MCAEDRLRGPGRARGATRTGGLAAALAAGILASPAAPAGRAAPAAADTVPIAAADADRNGDFLPDRLGDTVTLSGRATVGSRVLNQSSFRIFLRDSTGGIQLYD